MEMSIKEKLENDLKEAMRAKNEPAKKVIRMVLSSIKMAEIEKRSALDEPSIISLLHKEIKSRHESIADAEKMARKDIIADSEADIAIIERYLPAKLTPQELEEIVRQVIGEVGATSMREVGQVMKVMMPRLQGRATGEQANQVVRKLLT
jgi:uncharacterized protein